MPIRSRWTVQPPPKQLEYPEYEMVFCSSRPIDGHKTWRSDSNGANSFYAIINMCKSDAKRLYALNADNNAIRMMYATEEEAIADSLERYRKIFHLRFNEEDTEIREKLIQSFLQRRNKREED